MNRETRVPALPDIRQDNTLDVLRAIKATIDVREGSIGDPLDQNVTLRDLADLNLVLPSGNARTARQGGGTLPVLPVLPPSIGGYNPATDYTVPPAPTNLRARGGFTNVYLEWDGAPYRNHAYTEIWRSSVDNLGQAVLVGTTAASLYADPAQPDTTYYYWVRFVSSANVTGPYNNTSGTQAKTALDVSAAITAISSTITSSQLFRDLGTRIEGIEYSINLSAEQQAALSTARAQLETQVTKNGSGIIALNQITATQATSIKLLGTRVGDAESIITNLQTTTANQALSLTGLTTRLGTAESNIINLQTTTSTQAQSITDLNTSVSTKSKVFFQAAAPTSSAAYTLRAGDLWYDTDDGNKSYRHDGSAWVAFVNAAKVYYQTIAPVAAASAPLFVGDLWYDSDDDNHPYRWNGSAWVSLRDGYINARVVTLEQTKIGYATLNSTGRVFDNGGTIVDRATADAWNAANPGNPVTWRVGLPFATAVKQVSVSDGADELTLEQRFTAQKTVNGELYGQYTVKIDDRGHVSGFGLASTSVNGTPTSAFIVRADRFAIVGANDTTDPLGTLTPTKLPFIVTNTPTVVNGKTYPAGTWIDTAFVANATITNAQIADLTADKITAGSLSAALGVSTGKIWGGVAISSNKDNGTFGQLLYPFGSTNFGTGFFLGLDSSVYKFYVGSPTQNMRWDGSALSVTGNLNAISGSFRNVTVYDSDNNVILSSNGIPFNAVNGLGNLAMYNSLSYAEVTGTKPPTDATRNQVASGALASRPTGADGDFYYATDTYTLYQKVAGSWVISGTVGAPAGTLINGVAVAAITGAVTNFNNSNDRNSAAIAAPTISTNGTAVDHALQTNGSADISFEWAWSGNEGDIDGFQVYVYQSSSSSAYSFGGSTADEMVYEVPAAKRAFILYGVVPDRYYTFGVRAYRIVDKDVNTAGVITSAIAKPTAFGENPYQPSAQVAFGGNVTGTVNGIAATNVNVWNAISGTGKPADNATRNTVYRQSSAPTGATVNDIWFNTSTAAVSYWNGSAWVLAGDVTANNQAASVVNQGALATANSVFIGSTVKMPSGATLNTGDFVNTLSKIGTGNINNFIDGAAITDAYIGNLNASKITAGTIAADRLDATIITGKVANLQTAQIGDAQVTTLKINGQAVSVPLGAYNPNALALSGSYTTVATLAISRSLGSGGAVPMVGVISYTHQNTNGGTQISGSYTVVVRVLRTADNAEVFWGSYSALGAWTTPYTASFRDTYEGSTNYQMQVRIEPGAGNQQGNAYYSSMTLLETRR